jgi:hypothetical protein
MGILIVNNKLAIFSSFLYQNNNRESENYGFYCSNIRGSHFVLYIYIYIYIMISLYELFYFQCHQYDKILQRKHENVINEEHTNKKW